MDNFSKSEQNGLNQIDKTVQMILSVGVSTDGNAEIAMAQRNPNCKIIATTIDKKGIEETHKKIAELGLENQIELKLEDVSKPMPYQNDTFDYVYARLVLHYLDKENLENALMEIYRVLKPSGKLYTAVKSDKELTYKETPVSYDETTKMTGIADPLANGKLRYRQFLNTQSMTEYLKKFKVLSTDEYQEQTYHDYERTIPADDVATLVEAIAQKE